MLADILAKFPHVAVDVRSNGTLGEGGTRALTGFLLANHARAGRPVRTLCGVTHDSPQLHVPHDSKKSPMASCDLQIVAAELVANVFAEGISGSMGLTTSQHTLNRVSTAFRADWLPLVWAAKFNHIQLATEMLARTGAEAEKHGLKVDVNQPETHHDKQHPVHKAAASGATPLLDLLIKNGAQLDVLDKHGNSVMALAQKKRQHDLISYLREHEDEYGAWNLEDHRFVGKKGA